MDKVAIVAAKRTAIGNFGGSLSSLSAPKLGSEVIKSSLEQIKLDPSLIDEVIMGNVLTAAIGQNPARQSAIFANIPYKIPATTINVVCGSALKAIQIATNSILLNQNEIVIAGGQESMSLAPYVISDLRFGKKMGNSFVIDSMIFDGLTDAYNNYHMGITAENLAIKYNISRQEQDKFALNSQIKATKAQNENKFVQEIVPISIFNKKKDSIVFQKDEFIKPYSTIETISKARPIFKEGGSVTAANSSGINDGASVIILMSKKKSKELKIEPLAYIDSFAVTGCDPSIMGIAPVSSIKQVLQKSSWNIKDVDLWELNEAFASQSLAVIKELNLDQDKLNVNGGAIALGHPIGSSGCRILVTLIYEMIRQGSRRGIASLCIGGGMGISVSIIR